MSDENVARQLVKQVQFLQCEPAHLDSKGDGEPAAVITVEFLGEIEPSTMTLRDVEAMTKGLLRVLNYFDRQNAAEAMTLLWPTDNNG